MDTRLKIFLACALGAFIGALTALEINGDFWWLGCIFGGFIGYTAYNFGVVIQAVPVAWQKTIEWKPNSFSWKNRVLTTAAYFSVLMSAVTFFVLGVLLSSYIHNSTFWHVIVAKKGEVSESATMIMVVAGLPFAFIAIFGLVAWAVNVTTRVQKWSDDDNAVAWSLIIGGNPIAVFIYWPIVGLVHSPPYVWLFTKTVGKFLWTLFKLVHSEERLLCGVWAATGSLIGYFAGSAIIGAAAGGLLGVLDYEILSKRVLHLVPSQT